MNHSTPINSPNLGLVNIREVGYTDELSIETIIHRVNNEALIPTLILIDPSSIPSGIVMVYNEDKTHFRDFNSIVEAAVVLNPTDPSVRRGRETKISRLMGLDATVQNELGNFYFVKNPNTNRFKENQAGRFPCYLYDLEDGTCLAFKGLRPVVTHLSEFRHGKFKVTYDRVKTCYDKSTTFENARVMFARFKIVPIIVKPIINPLTVT